MTASRLTPRTRPGVVERAADAKQLQYLPQALRADFA
jgi:hypothetical protein